MMLLDFDLLMVCAADNGVVTDVRSKQLCFSINNTLQVHS